MKAALDQHQVIGHYPSLHTTGRGQPGHPTGSLDVPPKALEAAARVCERPAFSSAQAVLEEARANVGNALTGQVQGELPRFRR